MYSYNYPGYPDSSYDLSSYSGLSEYPSSYSDYSSAEESPYQSQQFFGPGFGGGFGVGFGFPRWGFRPWIGFGFPFWGFRPWFGFGFGFPFGRRRW